MKGDEAVLRQMYNYVVNLLGISDKRSKPSVLKMNQDAYDLNLLLNVQER